MPGSKGRHPATTKVVRYSVPMRLYVSTASPKVLEVVSTSVYDVEHAKTVQMMVESWKSTQDSRSYAPKKKPWYLLRDRDSFLWGRLRLQEYYLCARLTLSDGRTLLNDQNATSVFSISIGGRKTLYMPFKLQLTWWARW